MKNDVERLRLVHIEQLAHSIKGAPRWKFTAQTDDGLLLSFKTASNAGSGYRCNLNRLRAGDFILARYHQTATGELIADMWDDFRSKGIDLSHVVAVFPLPRGCGATQSQTNPSGGHHG